MRRQSLLCSALLSALAALAASAQEHNHMLVTSGPLSLAFDKQHGCIASFSIGKKKIVEGNSLPPLAGTLLESAAYDQFKDYVPDATLLAGQYVPGTLTQKKEGRVVELTATGALAFGVDAIHATFTYRLHPDSAIIESTLKLQPKGSFAKRYIRELRVQLPTALNFRKRVVMGGDQGWQFDSRTFYQFHLNTVSKLMPEPEHNHWRLFSVEQDDGLHFRAWRAESSSTPPLVTQHGQRAPGWMAEYDEQGGLLFAYRRLADRAPKALALDAAGGGLALISLYAPSWQAIPPQGAAAKSLLWDRPHQIDWIAFEGAFDKCKPQALLATLWGLEKLQSDPPAKPQPLELELWNAGAATDQNAPMVIGGLPIPRGALHKPEAARLWATERGVPLQTRPLAYWPDGSVKWLLLVFRLQKTPGGALRNGPAAGTLLPFTVTLRSGKEHFVLEYGDQVQAGSAPAQPLQARQQGDSVQIDTGPLQVTLTSGENWLSQVRVNGILALRARAQPLAFADFLKVDGTYLTNSAHPTGELDPGAVKIDSIMLEESGPLRAVVRLEGTAQAQDPARIILRVEAYAGCSRLRLFHSIEFGVHDTRSVFLRSLGLRLPLALEGKARVRFGGQKGPESAGSAARIGLREISHLNYRAWSQKELAAEPKTIERGQRCRGWMSLGDDKLACTVVLRNMWQEYPKELVADTVGHELTAYLWPESSPLMDVRRYSNYPHLSQGESVGTENWWVEEWYYQKKERGPFVGVSKSHELLLWFHEPDVTPAQLDAVAADFQSPPLVYVSPEYYDSTGITLPLRPADAQRFPRIERNIANFFDFILFHQKLWGWYGMWDFGDIGHRFAQGYGGIVKPDALAELLKRPAAERHQEAVPGEQRVGDYSNLRDWDFDNGRWGWSNTEGLPGLSLQLYYLRTGRREIYFAAEAMARHVRDVDMRHSGAFFGCGTRHGVQHWSDGDHEERQVVASEYRFYHYLSGDMRCRDFLKELTQKVFTRGRCESAADHSGRLYGIFTYWEMTGDKGLADVLKNYARSFIVPEGIDTAPPVQFPEGKRFDPKPREINGEAMWYHSFGAEHALLEYQQATGDSEVAQAILRMASHYAGQARWSGNFRKAVAFAALHAPDGARFREAIMTRWPRNSWEAPALFQCVTNNRKHWTGETGLMVVELPFTLFYLQDIFYVLTALEGEPQPTPELEARMAQFEAQGHPHSFSQGSLQSEYDREDLQEYLKERPWPEHLGRRKD